MNKNASVSDTAKTSFVNTITSHANLIDENNNDKSIYNDVY